MAGPGPLCDSWGVSTRHQGLVSLHWAAQTWSHVALSTVLPVLMLPAMEYFKRIVDRCPFERICSGQGAGGTASVCSPTSPPPGFLLDTAGEMTPPGSLWRRALVPPP